MIRKRTNDWCTHRHHRWSLWRNWTDLRTLKQIQASLIVRSFSSAHLHRRDSHLGRNWLCSLAVCLNCWTGSFYVERSDKRRRLESNVTEGRSWKKSSLRRGFLKIWDVGLLAMPYLSALWAPDDFDFYYTVQQWPGFILWCEMKVGAKLCMNFNRLQDFKLA